MLKSFMIGVMCVVASLPLLASQNIDKQIEEITCREGRVQVEGGELAYKTMGKGDPLIVLHGGPGLTKEYLLPAMQRLAVNNFVIFYDQRGSGEFEGEISDRTVSIEKFTADLDAVRKHFGLEKVMLLGHSWGAMVAMQYAIANPKHVSKLILSNSIPADREGFSLFVSEWVNRMTPLWDKISETVASKAFADKDPEEMWGFNRLIFTKYLVDPNKIDELELKMSRRALQNQSKVYQVFQEGFLKESFDLCPSLKKLQIPTLVIHGDDDIVPIQTAKTLHDSIKGADFIVLKNCGHFPFIEQPNEYFSAIKQFLSNTKKAI